MLAFVFFFFDSAGHCSYNVYPRLGYGMTEVRILETCNFSYPLSIHFISSRAIVCPTCCQVHPSIRLEETKSSTRTSVYATSFRYRFTSSLCTRMYLYATAILCSHTSSILFVCSCPIVQNDHHLRRRKMIRIYFWRLDEYLGNFIRNIFVSLNMKIS